jgi:hypothetical protein
MMKDGKINDEWAHAFAVSEKDMQHLASGLGWDLQIDDDGNVIAYKTGDMDKWRGMAAIDFKNKTFIVYFANSPNGHMLADHIISPHIELTHGFNNFFTKFGFARNIENGYKLSLTTDTELQPGIIYLSDNKKGLEYQFLNHDGELEKHFLPWFRFPEDYPKNASLLIEKKSDSLPTLLLQEVQFTKIGAHLEAVQKETLLRVKDANTSSLRSQSMFEKPQPSSKRRKDISDKELAKSTFASHRKPKG